MSKAEQVSTRMDILTETLGQTMAAAGIHTEDLSTNLRSMKTDLDNLQSSAEQTLASFLTGTELVEIRSTIKAATDSIEKAHGELTLNLLETNRSAAIHLANAANITEEDLKSSLDKIDAFRAGFEGSQNLIVNAVVKASIATKKAQREGIQAEAQEAQRANRESLQKTKEMIDKQKQAIFDLEVEKVSITGQGKDKRLRLLDEEIQAIKNFILELEGAGSGAIERANAMLTAQIEANLAIEKKEDKEKKKRASQRAKERRKERAAAFKAQIEADKAAEKEALRATTESARLKRALEIEFFDDEKDIQKKHDLEMRDLQIRKNEDLRLNDEATFEQRQLLVDQFAAEEVRLARIQADELLDIQKRADDQRLAEQEKTAKKAAEILRLQREEFQKEMSEIARATNLLEAPINALVENQRTGVVQVRAMGGALMATSAAMNVYANETDTSASAGERFKQGLPAMTHAGGIAAAAFVKNTKNKAIVQGSFEAASSIAAFATGNIPAGVGHAAAASMFFALAGKGGSGKTGGGQAAKTGALSAGGGGPSGLTAMGGGGAITVNVQGFALGSAREMGAKMAQTIDQARETGLDSSEV